MSSRLGRAWRIWVLALALYGGAFVKVKMGGSGLVGETLQQN